MVEESTAGQDESRDPGEAPGSGAETRESGADATPARGAGADRPLGPSAELRELIQKIERFALILGGIATAASAISLDLKMVAGVFLGAAIGWLNVAAVRFLTERGLSHPSGQSVVMGAFGVKFMLLATIVTILVLGVGVSGVGFIIGFSASVVSAALVPLWFATRSGASGS